MADELTAEINTITKELLEKIVRNAEKNEALTVKEFTVKRATDPGDNYATIALRAHVEVDGGPDADLVIKVPPEGSGMMKGYLINSGVFQKEIAMYEQVLPSYVKFQQDLGVAEPLVPSAPRCFHGFTDTENLSALIATEDLKPAGYKMADVRAGFDFEHAKLVFKELAKIHALSMAMKKHDPEGLRKRFEIIWMETHFKQEFAAMTKPMFADAVAKAIEMCAASPDEKFNENVKRILNVDPFDDVVACFKPEEPFAVICHGDAWGNNMLFKYQEENGVEKPIDIKLIDLQICRYALPTTDLGYFLLMSTTRSMRKAHMGDLLKLYHKTFHEVLAHCKFSLPEFTYEVFFKMFKKTLLYGMVCSCLALPAVMTKTAVDRDVNEAGTEEQVREGIKEMMAKAMSSGAMKPVIERLTGNLEELIELGL